MLTKKRLLSKAKIRCQLSTLIEDLEKSESLFIPDPHAGYQLVDPVVTTAIAFWWRELWGLPEVKK